MITSSVTFDIAELWLLQSVIRHEMAQQGEWKFPFASLDLNDRVAAAILFCDENHVSEASMQLSRGDTLCVDYNVRSDMKDAQGKQIGKLILLKSFRVRRDLNDENPMPMAECDDKLLPLDAIDQLIASMPPAKSRRTRRPKGEK